MIWKIFRDFLIWFWPALLTAVAALVSVALTASGIWEGAKIWAEGAFLTGVIIINNPWSYAFGVNLFLLWLFLLVFSSSKVDKDGQVENHKMLTMLAEEVRRVPSGILPPISDSVEHIESWHNRKLKAEVAKLADELRVYEGQRQDLPIMPRVSPAMTEDEKNAAWEEGTNAVLVAAARHQLDFQRQFQSRLTAYRDELRRRLNEHPPYAADHRSIAIDYGVLAGRAPLSNAANVIEQMARKLPDN